MTPADQDSRGLWPSLRRLLDTGLAALQNRAELFVVEFREEKAHAVQLFIWAAVVLFMGMMATIALTTTIVLIFPERHRLYVLGAFCVLYLAGAGWAVFRLGAQWKQQAMPFAGTISEVRKDREWLQGE